MRLSSFSLALMLSFVSCVCMPVAFAQGEEAMIRKTLKERMPQVGPKV